MDPRSREHNFRRRHMIAAVSGFAARIEDLDVVETGDGYVVYHPDRDRVHFVNPTAAVVLELCDGTKSDAEICRLVQLAWDLPEPPEAEVAECMAQFRAEGLVA
jgi:hypothetical protein